MGSESDSSSLVFMRQRKRNSNVFANHHHCEVHSHFDIKGGPDILLHGQLHTSQRLSPQIFAVPRRGINPSDDDPISFLHDLETQITPGLRGEIIQNRTAMNPLDDGEISSSSEEDNVRIIVLYEGNDYGREALMIACTGLALIFVLTCIGFGCIISEQLEIKRRRSMSYNMTTKSPSRS